MACSCPVISWKGTASLGNRLYPPAVGALSSGAIEEVGGDAIVWAPMQRGALAEAIVQLNDRSANR